MQNGGEPRTGAHAAHARSSAQHASASSQSRPYQAADHATVLPVDADASQYSRSSYGSSSRARGKDGKRGPWRVVFWIAIVVLVAALAVLGAIAYQYWAQQHAYDDLEQYAQVTDEANLALSDLSVDWEALYAINPDIVAWIYIPNTNINYPVVQGDDNDEYLHKAFDGSTGWLASAGTIFLDSSNAAGFTDRNSALYGHHMNDGSMFAALADWYSDEEFNKHRDVYLLTPAGNYRLKTFALVKTVGTDAIVQTGFSSAESYTAYIQDKLDRSVAQQEGDVLSAADVKQSVLLSTCEYTQDNGRAVLFAAVVETTASIDPYVSAVDSGTTGLSSETNAEMDSEYKEAA